MKDSSKSILYYIWSSVLSILIAGVIYWKLELNTYYFIIILFALSFLFQKIWILLKIPVRKPLTFHEMRNQKVNTKKVLWIVGGMLLSILIIVFIEYIIILR